MRRIWRDKKRRIIRNWKEEKKKKRLTKGKDPKTNEKKNRKYFVRMVAPVYTFDPKILPEGSAKLRWAGRGAEILCIFRGQIRSSETATGGEGGAQRLVWGWQWAQKDGCAQRTGAHAGPKPTSSIYFWGGGGEAQSQGCQMWAVKSSRLGGEGWEGATYNWSGGWTLDTSYGSQLRSGLAD